MSNDQEFSYNSNPLTLILIDQQQGIDNPRLGERNNPNAQQVMLSILTFWRDHHLPVVHVKHKSKEPQSVFWPEQDGFEFKKKFLPLEKELVIEKSVPCAFINSQLDNKLKGIGSKSIAIVGASTNNSVEATARTGGNLGYAVYVVEDACFAFAKEDYFGIHRTAQEVHAMSLANLEGEYAKIINSHQLINIVSVE